MMFNLLFSSLTLLTTVASTLTYKGVDWSSTTVSERAGNVYLSSTGQRASPESILVSSGVNTVRQRIWVTDGDYGLSYNLALAKRAHAAGLQIYLDFHYSPTWADPGHQMTPPAWAGYKDVGTLKYAVYNYTLDTMNAFADAEIPLALVSIGNEITNGLLFPLGNVTKSPSNVGAILHSASAGVKDSKLATKPKIMIHLDNGWNFGTQQGWYDKVLGSGNLKSADFDIQGVSYYPFYNSEATLASLKSSLNQMKTKYGKGMCRTTLLTHVRCTDIPAELQVVETDWPISCPDPEYAFPSDTTSIPFSAAGQSTWMKDIASIVSAVGGTGLFYWEPLWIDNAALGSSCNDTLMVAGNGQVLSSLAVFKDI